MSLAFKQLRVYVRLVIVLLVVGAVALVLVQNRSHEARIWFFWLTDDEKPVNVVWLMVCTAVGALLSWWTLSLAWSLIRDMREVKRQRAVQDAARRLDEREAALAEREQSLEDRDSTATEEDGATEE